MTALILVGCGKTKRQGRGYDDSRVVVRDLYIGNLFLARRSYVEAPGRLTLWMVLSAKHGLLNPGGAVEPYDMTIADLTPVERRAWAQACEAARDCVNEGHPHLVAAAVEGRAFWGCGAASWFFTSVPLAQACFSEAARGEAAPKGRSMPSKAARLFVNSLERSYAMGMAQSAIDDKAATDWWGQIGPPPARTLAAARTFLELVCPAAVEYLVTSSSTAPSPSS